ncbi:hypothetical protein LO762_04055 [Actinocorallia sp. API 0066]|uniref:hypothetical protein n=1 Tax=Actinocorallia sp. API 0066 TaxID=2896846 RepID=UPI001E2B18E7|nr:hypothetical protein [Actinocorallia sp. API 0066]MCD0448372.1 hypothetical protein [Actinocorallia sp. API 0066]
MVTLTATPTLERSHIGLLSSLADRLVPHGLRARLEQPIGRPPALHVSNPAAPGAAEEIVLEDEALWWPWGERIAAVGDLDQATASVCQSLGVPAHSTPRSTGYSTWPPS